MDIELLLTVLGWAALINYAVLIVWFLIFIFARNVIYKIHSQWFSIPNELYDTIMFCFMGGYKLLVMMFFLTPYIVLRIAA